VELEKEIRTLQEAYVQGYLKVIQVLKEKEANLYGEI
jgi:hypothetical protein